MTGREGGSGPSPDGAAGEAAARGGNGAAWWAGLAPVPFTAPPSPDRFGEWWRFRWSCRRLDKLARVLARQGWGTAKRYGQSPPALHVFAPDAPMVGDTVTVIRGDHSWWFRSSTGGWLGPCSEAWRAAESLTALLGLWGISVRTSRRRS